MNMSPAFLGVVGDVRSVRCFLRVGLGHNLRPRTYVGRIYVFPVMDTEELQACLEFQKMNEA
jgi:hypothetical protein